MATLHLQQQILNTVQTVLSTGGTAAGNRVQVERVDPLPQKTTFPVILIEESDRGESVDQETIHGLQRRVYELVIDNLVQVNATYGADARALGLQVEKLLLASTALAALCQGGVEIVASTLPRDGAGEKPLASRRQVWRFTYFVNPATPDVVV